MQSHSSLGHFSTNTPMNMNRFAGNTMNAFQPHAGQFQHMSRATNMLPMNLSAQQPSLNMGSNRSVGQSIAAGRVLQPPNMQPRPTNPALPSRGVVNMSNVMGLQSGSSYGSGDMLSLLNKGNPQLMHHTTHQQQLAPSGELPRFDMTDFPALGGDNSSALPKLPNSQQEFAIQNEDFPALSAAHPQIDHRVPMHSASATTPAQSPPSSSSSGILSSTAGSVKAAATPSAADSGYGYSLSHSLPPAYSSSNSASMPSQSPETIAEQPAQQPADSQPATQAPGGAQSAIRKDSGPAGVAAFAASRASRAKVDPVEKYGLMGLLSVIRMTDLDLNTLSLGTDLTTFGLNLNSQEVLYPTFGSPWADSPLRRDPDYILPQCYYMSPPVLKTSHLAKFCLETLFYIFYNMPKDALQVYASKELYNRGWAYHKEHRLWFRNPGEAVAKGHYVYFDINSWEKRLFHDPGNALSHKFMTPEEVAAL